MAMLAIAGCAQRLVLQPVTVGALSRPEPRRTLVADAVGQPVTGSARPLLAGTVLQPIGMVGQGVVMRPVGREITVYGEDREEAFIVVEGARWVGFYLPFERGYLPLRSPILLQME